MFGLMFANNYLIDYLHRSTTGGGVGDVIIFGHIYDYITCSVVVKLP